MTLTANWSYPTAIRFGAGRIGEITDACAATGMKKPLLVTDKMLASLPITMATLEIGRAHVRTPVTSLSRMPSSA